jgi:hypothetical protein
MSIEVVGEEKVIATCEGIARRTNDLMPVFEVAVERQEAFEEEIFAEGKYVQTGMLRDSLTSANAEGAVRDVRPTTIRFGSSIWYARFQVEDPGPVTDKGGLERKGHKSAVLKRAPRGFQVLTTAAGEYIMRGAI